METTTDEAREAWRKYISTGALVRASLREPVYRAWERCHLLGPVPGSRKPSPSRPPEPTVCSKSALLQAARPFVRALSRAAGQERHAAMVSDESGIVLEVIGDEQTLHGPEPFPGPGTLLAEAVSGANGIGTPLAEGAYVELVGPEHFIGGFHAFTCQGVPARAPDGQVAGVISTSTRPLGARRKRPGRSSPC